jgi:uncharacterized membrane protein YeaQ/YmgE (transglycosylase-associated protein family)
MPRHAFIAWLFRPAPHGITIVHPFIDPAAHRAARILLPDTMPVLRSIHCRLPHLRRITMGIIMWLVIGGIVGWLASIIMRRDAQQGIFLNIIVGIVGAVLAGWLIAPLFGIGTINQGLSVASFLISLVGAILLLAIVNLFTRGRAR